MQPHRIAQIIVLIWCWLLPTYVLAANQPVLLPEHSFDYSISPYIYVYEDSSASLTINDMVKLQQQLLFRPSHSQSLKFGLSSSYYWLRFSVTNPHANEQSVIFTLSESNYPIAKMFDITHLDYPIQLESHDPSRALSGGGMQFYSMALSIPAHATNTFLVKIRVQGLLSSHAHLLSRDRFLLKEQFFFGVLGFSLGLLIASIAFFLYLWKKQRRCLPFLAACFGVVVLVAQPTVISYLLYGATHYVVLKDIIFTLAINTAAALYLMASALLPWEGRRERVIKRLLWSFVAVQLLSAVIISIWFRGAEMPISAFTMMGTFLGSSILLSLGRSQNVKAQKWLRTGYIIQIVLITLVIMTFLNLLSLDILTLWGSLILPGIALVIFIAATQKQTDQAIKPQHHHIPPLTADLLAQIGSSVRAPINGLMGMNDLLLDTPLSSQQRKFANAVAANSRELLHVSNEINDWAGIQAQNLRLELQAVNLGLLLKNILTDFQHEAARRQIELVLDIHEDLPTSVQMDRTRLHTVLRNIISRALTYTEYGAISVQVKPYSAIEHTGIHIQIQLNCTILRQDELRGAFQIFQHQYTLSERNAAYPWNLLLTRHLLREMKANLHVENMTSQGASLSLMFPLKNNMDSPPNQYDGVLIGRRILIVDDNASLRAVLERQTKRWGMKAHTAHSGKEALALLRNQSYLNFPYDFIVIDNDMPLMNGIMLAERIQQDTEIPHKPAILLLTNLNITEVLYDSLTASIQSVLSKPIEAETLRHELLKILPFTPSKFGS